MRPAFVLIAVFVVFNIQTSEAVIDIPRVIEQVVEGVAQGTASLLSDAFQMVFDIMSPLTGMLKGVGGPMSNVMGGTMGQVGGMMGQGAQMAGGNIAQMPYQMQNNLVQMATAAGAAMGRTLYNRAATVPSTLGELTQLPVLLRTDHANGDNFAKKLHTHAPQLSKTLQDMVTSANDAISKEMHKLHPKHQQAINKAFEPLRQAFEGSKQIVANAPAEHKDITLHLMANTMHLADHLMEPKPQN